DKAAPAVTAPTTADKAAPAVTAPTTADKATPAVAAPTTATSAQVTELTKNGLQLVSDAKIDNFDVNKLSSRQINSLNAAADKYYQNPNKTPNSNAVTYKNFDDLIKQLQEQPKNIAIPQFNSQNIKNLPAVTTESALTGKIEDLDIWDSWMVQDAQTQKVADVQGHQVMFALAGSTKEPADTHIYMLTTPYKATTINSWQMVGPVFGYNAVPWSQEWSGSATVNKDGSIQLFYTRVTWNDTIKQNMQRLSTINIVVRPTNSNGLAIENVNNDHIIFDGDGKYYQNIEQTVNSEGDNFTLRDPHVIEVDGQRYLSFETNTGTNNPEGYENVTDLSNYGGSLHYNVTKLLELVGNDAAFRTATLANGALGLLRLTQEQNNPTVTQIYDPLVTSNMVTDEIERANIVPLNGKYYLFTDTRLEKSSLGSNWNKSTASDIAMLGYVSDTLFGDYKPLNINGVVLVANKTSNDRTATYSYYAVPVDGYSDRLLITSYMSNRGMEAGNGLNATTAPSFIIQINADGTTAVEQTITTQND
ncbi:glycoside hydrolase family 68 protein, partial [Leuconostoc citreum]|uniref:glycoside hydrolase family 68 protein n=1 Tax=Leuconostoc citreum TaxID=33964 RepID=UPI0015DB2682